MIRTLLRTTVLSAALLASAPALAQSASANAQCDAMMMAGTQNYAPSAVAGCTAYFQALANGAAAPGAFSGSTPAGALVVSVSTSGG